MAPYGTIWVGKEIKTGKMEMRKTLKSLCETVGVNYTTGKRRMKRGVMTWVVGPGNDSKVWVVNKEVVPL